MNSMDPLHRRVENYRESCDNCAKSKVRCGKEQPWCQRCTRRGQICSYSPSQRSRKRTLSNTHLEGEQRTAALPFAAMSSSASMNALLNGSSVLLGQADSWGSCPDLVELLTSSSNSESLTPDNTNLAWLSDIESIAGDNSIGKSMERLEASTYLKRHAPSTSSLLGMGSSGGTSVENEGLRPMNSITDRQHCEADLISALAKPDLPTLSCWVDSKSSQNLGTILTASRSTLTCVTTVMSCTCTPNDNVALLFTAVLLRILSWYHIVLQNCHSHNDNSSTAPTDGYTSSAASTDGKEQERPSTRDTDVSQDISEQSSIIMPPITIGAYELDSENRERIIGHIMLSELTVRKRLEIK
ncbi:probable pathway specific binuclear zinc cluster transcription factor for the aurofusarin gene cluster [Fusarium torulosum]|uniref:Probable pathway specific binuclear zinc cluster transcription factor for the aurofusarin gene cluster n=1 Tax=Fusarium torulosum TaxID=33205 RepID=A0AAE8MK79_9HYPO|nr:probable pathway specific binuclear zinc cluster transcription factor for the aurofusarin gene cluster [Fusarium torulosum]